MLSVEHLELQREGIDSLHATEIDAKMAGHSCRFVEGIDTAVFAEIVLCRLDAKLIQTQGTLRSIELEALGRDGLGRHHGPTPRTERAIATESRFDLFTFVGERDRAAMATALVVGHGYLPDT